jgi:hypothetical protein
MKNLITVILITICSILNAQDTLDIPYQNGIQLHSFNIVSQLPLDSSLVFEELNNVTDEIILFFDLELDQQEDSRIIAAYFMYKLSKIEEALENPDAHSYLSYDQNGNRINIIMPRYSFEEFMNYYIDLELNR